MMVSVFEARGLAVSVVSALLAVGAVYGALRLRECWRGRRLRRSLLRRAVPPVVEMLRWASLSPTPYVHLQNVLLATSLEGLQGNEVVEVIYVSRLAQWRSLVTPWDEQREAWAFYSKLLQLHEDAVVLRYVRAGRVVRVLELQLQADVVNAMVPRVSSTTPARGACIYPVVARLSLGLQRGGVGVPELEGAEELPVDPSLHRWLEAERLGEVTISAADEMIEWARSWLRQRPGVYSPFAVSPRRGVEVRECTSGTLTGELLRRFGLAHRARRDTAVRLVDALSAEKVEWRDPEAVAFFRRVRSAMMNAPGALSLRALGVAMRSVPVIFVQGYGDEERQQPGLYRVTL